MLPPEPSECRLIYWYLIRFVRTWVPTVFRMIGVEFPPIEYLLYILSSNLSSIGEHRVTIVTTVLCAMVTPKIIYHVWQNSLANMGWCVSYLGLSISLKV